MNIGITLIVEIINFALFVYFFKKVLWGPLMGVMQARQAHIAEGLAAAEQGTKALEDAAAKSDDALKQARGQAQDILAAANKQAVQMVEQARQTARSEAERIAALARDEVQREAMQAREQLRKQVGELAVIGASKILKREINPATHADVLKDLAASI
ncbi:MAG TPA: F0F1 ATP synthase subunit B [Stenotrophobium sp.]|nr:F0F1 ATP synthase subunit B [Stenotrophobium sp.]